MIEKRYKDIESSMTILNDARAYRTQEKISFIKDIVSRYRSYLLLKDSHIKGKNIDLNTMIQNDLLKSKIGKFTFIGVYNIATKIKIVMRYSIVLEILILYVNSQLKSYQAVIILTIGIGLAILTEGIVIIKALDKKQDELILNITEYILYKYPMELEGIEQNKNHKKRLSDGVDENINYQVFEQGDLNVEGTKEICENSWASNKKNTSKISKGIEKKITDTDIADVIRSINMSKNKPNT